MDYTLVKKTVSVKETVFDGCAEQPVDLDLTLPDYCPDILRILKCKVTPKILNKSISGDRLDIEGSAGIKILYIDAVKKALRSSDHSIPFSSSFNMKQSPQNGIVIASAKTEYVNCRALSPRRLDIHGAFSVCAKVVCKNGMEIPCDVQDESVQVKKARAEISVLEGMAQQQFTLSDSVSLGSDAKNIEAILKSDAVVSSGECKALGNKIMIKGDVNIRVLYLADMNTGDTGIFDYTMPYSEILDADGVSEDSLCITSAELVSHSVNIQQEYSQNGTVVNFEVKLSTYAFGYGREVLPFIDDAYSTDIVLDMTYNHSDLMTIERYFSESCITKASVETGSESISSVTDIWCEQCVTGVLKENDGIMIKGKLNMCILARNGENIPFYSERVVEFTYPIPKTEDGMEAMAKGMVQSVSYRINGGNKLDLRIETKLNITLVRNNQINYVSSVTSDSENKIKKDGSALILYYASQGESVWNIAKEYAVSCKAVMAENELDSDKISAHTVLFIPNV